MQWKCRTESEAETECLGRAVAGELHPGMVVALSGPLGAGKTRLVQAIAAGLGVERGTVNSPTFVLIQEHEGRWPLYHFDTYRLRDLEEFLELGAEELMAGEGVCLIEWADRVAEVLPADALWITIEPVSATARDWEFRGSGPRSIGAIAGLSAPGK